MWREGQCPGPALCSSLRLLPQDVNRAKNHQPQHPYRDDRRDIFPELESAVDGDGAEEPDAGDRDDFDANGDAAVGFPIAQGFADVAIVQKPLFEHGIAFAKCAEGQDEKHGSGQAGQDVADDADAHESETDDRIKPPRRRIRVNLIHSIILKDHCGRG
jgi:hypothetical protein